MHSMYRRSWATICAVLTMASLGSATAQTDKPVAANPPALKNVGFEDGQTGKQPVGWFFPPVCKEAGYKLATSEEQPFAGKRCAVLSRTDIKPGDAFGNVLQSLDATSFRGKRIRFRAAVRTEVAGAGNQAMLWLRVDRANNEMGFFDNMSDRPIVTKDWRHFEIVGDVARDARNIVLGMMLVGHGSAAIDDVSFEIVDQSSKVTSPSAIRPAASPGLAEVLMARRVTAQKQANTSTMMFPLPLAYRDQVPLTFRLSVDPPAAAKSVEIVRGAGDNRVMKITLQDLGKHRQVDVAYRSLVLVGPTRFDQLPKSVQYPKDWPEEAKPWLTSTWCVDHADERVKKLASEIRGESDDVLAVIAATLSKAKSVFGAVKGRGTCLTAVEALDKQGSCTSCANLVAALLRGAGVPARVLSGYPAWSGPLQTHYIVEAFVPGYGWYPLESTLCRVSWPNYQQVNVSIVPVEHEQKSKAGPRPAAAGGVPYLSLNEFEQPPQGFRVMGTLKQYCDHECRPYRAIKADSLQWSDSLSWAKGRWSQWLVSKPTIENGRVTFGPDADDVKGHSLDEVRAELK